MLKLKGQTESGEWVEFCLCPTSIYDIRQDKVLVFDNDDPTSLLGIDPATIQPADDPRKHPMFTTTCPNCDYEYMDPFEDGSFECPECELYLPPKKDPRKAMLDELRLEINKLHEYKSFVRVEGDPVPTLPQIDKWCVIWILDEMEAKL